jgi:hypothetical protein
MADQKVSDLPSLNGADVDAADLLYIVDSSAGLAGSKKITVAQYQLAPYSGAVINGVPYFDSNRVIASSAALTFDGTTLSLGSLSLGSALPVASGGTGSTSTTYCSLTTNVTGTLPATNGGTGSSSAFTANGIVYASSTSALATGSALTFDGTNFATTGTSSATKLIPTGGAATGNGMYLPAANTLAWSNNGAETMRLDSSGNLGLGGEPSASWSSSWSALQIGVSAAMWAFKSANGLSGSYFSNNSAFNGTSRVYINTAAATEYSQLTGQHIWYTAPSGTAGNAISFTQAMTLTSGGDLLVGTTTGAGIGVTVQPISTTIQNNNAQATGFVFTSYRRSSVEIGSITQNGTTAVLYNTTSDRRLKDNIAPAPSASDDIDAIQIVSHNWKSAPDEHVTYGVIAQDLALVAPQAVLQGDDGEEVEKTWGVDYSKLVPMIIKEIQTLRARVAALEQA